MNEEKLFPDVEQAREIIKKNTEGLSDRIVKELLEELPGRLQRNIQRGELYIYHSLSNFSICKTKQHVEAVQKVEELLRAEGYHVESYLRDYNGVYNYISMFISWDIEALKADKYIYDNYQNAISMKGSHRIGTIPNSIKI